MLTDNLPQLTAEPTAYAGGYHRVVQTLKVVDNGHRYGVGCVPAGKAARQVTMGPDVPGPWASAFGLAVCIDNHGGTGKESADRIADGLELVVSIGDTVVVDGHAYTVEYHRRGNWIDRHNIDLKPVDTLSGRG